MRKKFYNQWLLYMSLISEVMDMFANGQHSDSCNQSNLKLEEKLTVQQGKRRRRVLESWSRHVGRMKMLMDRLATAEMKFKVKMRRKQLRLWKQKTSFLMRLMMLARIVSQRRAQSYCKGILTRWRMYQQLYRLHMQKSGEKQQVVGYERADTILQPLLGIMKGFTSSADIY